jgi:hypothetical protein
MDTMTATLRKPATWVLAATLIVLSQTGVRCGDTYYPNGRVGHQAVSGR